MDRFLILTDEEDIATNILTTKLTNGLVINGTSSSAEESEK